MPSDSSRARSFSSSTGESREGPCAISSNTRSSSSRIPVTDALPVVAAWLGAPDVSLLDHNQAVARRHFSLDRLVERLGALLREAGWLGG